MAMNLHDPSRDVDRPHRRRSDALERYPHHMFSLMDHLFDAFDSSYEIPSRWLQEITGEQPAAATALVSTRITDNDRVFRIDLPVSGYTPDELNVKLIRDRFLVVEGQKNVHKEKRGDHEFVSGDVKQQFQRSFVIPHGVDVQHLRSGFNQDGTLSIEAPKMKRQELLPSDRNIAIEHSGFKGLENGPM